MLLKIKEVRNKKNITQDELAAKTGLSKRMILDYEREIKDIPVQKLQLIATALDCSIIDLLNVPKEYSLTDDYQRAGEPSKIDEFLEFQRQVIADLKRDKQELIRDKELLAKLLEEKSGNQKAS